MIESAVLMASNLGLLSLGAIGLFFTVHRLDGAKLSPWRSIALGLLLGVISLTVVRFPIEGPYGSQFDTRAAPIIMASFFGGPVTGVITASIGGLGRYMVGGPAVVGGVVSVYVYALFGYLLVHLTRWAGVERLGGYGWAATAVGASVAATPTFFILRPFDTAVAILEAFWPIFLGGNLIGVVVLGSILETLWSRENRTRRYATAIGVANDRLIASFVGAESTIYTMGHRISDVMRELQSSATLLKDAVSNGDQPLANRMIADLGAGLARLSAITEGLQDVERDTRSGAGAGKSGSETTPG